MPMTILIAQVLQNIFQHGVARRTQRIIELDHLLLDEYNHQRLMAAKQNDEREEVPNEEITQWEEPTCTGITMLRIAKRSTWLVQRRTFA